jgi:hypothetical protein
VKFLARVDPIPVEIFLTPKFVMKTKGGLKAEDKAEM